MRFLRMVNRMLTGTAVLLSICMIYDPLGGRQFLLDAGPAASIVPAAAVVALVGGGLALALYIAVLDAVRVNIANGNIDRADRRVRHLDNPFTSLLLGFLAVLIGAFSAHYLVITGFPVALHSFARKQEFSAPFVLQGLHGTKMCRRGMDVSNPDFYGDRVCRIGSAATLAPYVGKVIRLHGDRSIYGLAVTGFSLPDRIGEDQQRHRHLSPPAARGSRPDAPADVPTSG